MDTVNIILSGLGGQGILFMTKVMAESALHKGFNVMGAETHGMAQRGGSVVSHLRLGNVKGSLVRTGSAHLLLALEENEAYRNIAFLAEGGRLYANAPNNAFPRKEVEKYLIKRNLVYRAVRADDIALNLGAPMATNLALLGFFSAFNEGPVSHKELRNTIDRISPARFKALNLKVFDAGFERGKEDKGSK